MFENDALKFRNYYIAGSRILSEYNCGIIGVFRMKRGTARMSDFSFDDKKTGKRRKRYYIYIESSELVEDPDFPFTPKDKLFVYISDGKLIIEKM